MFLSYDSTFEGLLSALTVCLRDRREVWGIIPDGRVRQSLLPPEPVAVEPDILARFDRFLSRRFGGDVLELLFHAYLSEREDIEMRILGFLRLGMRIGGDPSGMLQEPDVCSVRDAARAVTRQTHAYLGLLRFRLSGGVYVADFEPDFHVLPLVAPHFSERMSDRPFLIRDRRRSMAVVSWPGQPWFIIALDAEDTSAGNDACDGGMVPRTDGEPGGAGGTKETYEEIWRSYFAVMAVPERINPSLQRSNMPKKYWKYLVEHPGEGSSRGLRYNGR